MKQLSSAVISKSKRLFTTNTILYCSEQYKNYQQNYLAKTDYENKANMQIGYNFNEEINKSDLELIKARNKIKELEEKIKKHQEFEYVQIRQYIIKHKNIIFIFVFYHIIINLIFIKRLFYLLC